MDNNFDFNSKKYIILLVVICLVFVMFIVKAFDYLPDNEVIDSNDNEIENINTPSKINTTENSDNTVVLKPKKNQKSGVLYRSKLSLTEEQPNIEEIDAPIDIVEESVPNDNINENSNQQLSPDLIALQSIINARNLANKNDLASALEEYKKVLSSQVNNEIKAEALEGIATLYAKNKKYGTALTFAGKAYSTSPSLSRDILIAKIYYSAGKTETAITRLNDILRHGFQ